MKVTCDVIRDILPLYVEDMASSDSSAIVEEHINQCAKCKEQLDEMKAYSKPPMDTNITPMLKIKSILHREKLQAIIFSIMFTVLVCFVTIAYLTAPEYIPYSEGTVSLIERDNGLVLAVFGDQVSGYDISIYPADDSTGYVYHITAWDSIWNRNTNKAHGTYAVLNPNSERVESVYYYLTDGSDDILIYGKNQNPGGGVITLPRLFLAYYLLVALILAIICGVIMILFGYNKKVMNVTTKVLFLPISYITGHFLIKGFPTSSYTPTRDFFGILLIMIPLYFVFQSALILIKAYKNKKSPL